MRDLERGGCKDNSEATYSISLEPNGCRVPTFAEPMPGAYPDKLFSEPDGGAFSNLTYLATSRITPRITMRSPQKPKTTRANSGSYP